MKPGIVLLGLTLGVCTTAVAQEAVQRDTLVDRYFTSAARDTAAIVLATGRQYRAEVLGPTAGLALTRPRAGAEAFLSPDPARTAPGHAVYEVYPRERGDHVVRISALGAGDSVRVIVAADWIGTRAQVARREDRERKRWSVGFRAGAGGRSGYPLDGFTDAGGGLMFDGGVRLASARFPVSVVLGAAVEQPGGSATRVDWFFGELEVRVFRASALQASLIGHLAEGNADRITIDPSYTAGGVSVVYALTRNAGRTGPALQGRYLYGKLSNIAAGPRHRHTALIGLLWTL
jgi:hypothetical protein